MPSSYIQQSGTSAMLKSLLDFVYEVARLSAFLPPLPTMLNTRKVNTLLWWFAKQQTVRKPTEPTAPPFAFFCNARSSNLDGLG
jgi:hypothetical protein